MRIGLDRDLGHKRVNHWTMACIVLHNLLHNMKDDESWIDRHTENQENQENQEIEEIEQEMRTESQKAGIRRRNELRELVASQKK